MTSTLSEALPDGEFFYHKDRDTTSLATITQRVVTDLTDDEQRRLKALVALDDAQHSLLIEDVVCDAHSLIEIVGYTLDTEGQYNNSKLLTRPDDGENRPTILAVNYANALFEMTTEWPASKRRLCEQHDALFVNTTFDGHDDAGQYRTIGVDSIPPKPAALDELSTDLFEHSTGFVTAERTHHDAHMHSGILHYQFETIHPFSDGNGRIGRAWALSSLFTHVDTVAALPVLSYGLRSIETEYYRAFDYSLEDNRDEWLSMWFNALHAGYHRTLDLAARVKDSSQATPSMLESHYL